MKIIAVEGIDKSGKATVSRAVTDYLTKKGYKVKLISFPRYDTPLGKLIQKALYSNEPMDPIYFECLQAADKRLVQKELIELEEQGFDFIVFDRYLATQLTYGIVNLEEVTFITFAENTIAENTIEALAGLSTYYPPKKADYTLFLKTSPQTSINRKGEHGENDQYENDTQRLEKVCEDFPQRCVQTSYYHPRTIPTDNQSLEQVVQKALEYVETVIL